MTFDFITYMGMLKELHELIVAKKTGHIGLLAEKFKLPSRLVRNMITDLEYWKKIVVKYDRECNSYVLVCNHVSTRKRGNRIERI